ncbi:MAG: hypothetical protein IPL23_26175 [Saprospiraceae bacterium]|nr:hypothetical protein [Saprospiraceae bacterium]
MSAIYMGIMGIIFIIIPDIVLAQLKIEFNNTTILMLQLMGALYYGFAMLNWMTKSALIGGIFNRPIAVANFTHFFIAGISLLRGLRYASGFFNPVTIVTVIYVALQFASP